MNAGSSSLQHGSLRSKTCFNVKSIALQFANKPDSAGFVEEQCRHLKLHPKAQLGTARLSGFVWQYRGV